MGVFLNDRGYQLGLRREFMMNVSNDRVMGKCDGILGKYNCVPISINVRLVIVIVAKLKPYK